MGKAVKKAIGSDLKGYQIFSYPTDNFGLITSYENSVSDLNFLCDMWNCIGVNDETVDSENWLKLNNFAGVGGGGTITLSEKNKTKVAVDVILPKIYDVVGLTAGFKKDQTKEINITIGKAFLRKLRREPIIDYINSLNSDKSLKKAFDNGNLVIVVADCVIESITVSVKVDQVIGGNIDAKLGITGTNVASKIFQDAQLSVNVEKNSSGTYTFKVLHPVIFARLAKKQPSGGSLSSDEYFNDWESVGYNSDPSKK
ncbi:hypothetical protein DM790_22585 [Flavobacterium collinsii]|nr:hypothetical protein [Flavobacterium collinsii]